MTMQVNWARLVAKNRAKAAGIPWTDEEMHAIHVLGISPDDVRAGILTKEDAVEADAAGQEKSLARMNKAELLEEAKRVGIDIVDPDAVTRGGVISLIQAKAETADKS